MGRGRQITHDTGFMDQRSSDVTVIRAMRELSRKEVAIYHNLQKLPKPSVAPTFSQAQEPLASVERLTEDFVVGLQEDFPATVPTIFRTGDKLRVSDPDREALEAGRGCLLCAGVVDSLAGRMTAGEASKFSKLVSLRGPNGFTEEELTTDRLAELSLHGTQMNNGGSTPGTSDKTTLAGVKHLLCYSCQVTADKMESTPEFVVERSVKLKGRGDLRGEIEDCLL